MIDRRTRHTLRRRDLCAAAMLSAALPPAAADPATTRHPDPKWYQAAEAMRQRALGWGDQPYGAVVVLPDGQVAEGPSRVVRNADPDAHAEREAIRDAQRRLGRQGLEGAVLYSTSRPCRLCEQAAARAGIGRMFFGAELMDAGVPRL